MPTVSKPPGIYLLHMDDMRPPWTSMLAMLYVPCRNTTRHPYTCTYPMELCTSYTCMAKALVLSHVVFRRGSEETNEKNNNPVARPAMGRSPLFGSHCMQAPNYANFPTSRRLAPPRPAGCRAHPAQACSAGNAARDLFLRCDFLRWRSWSALFVVAGGSIELSIID